MLRLATSLALLATVRACAVCVVGVCHEPRMLLERFDVTDQLAIDHGRNTSVLYVQLDGEFNTAVYLDSFRIVRLQRRNTTGLAVDQRSHALYTADHRNLYRFDWGAPDPVVQDGLLYQHPDRLFYKDVLYYTSNTTKGIHFIENNKSKMFALLRDYSITDFVVNKMNDIFFVSDNKVYVYETKKIRDPLLVAAKNYALSTDKFGDVYLGDTTENAIHKLDESYKMTLYAAYAKGSVDRFVFDKDNNIVFHDATSETVGYWKSNGSKCVAEPPHHKYLIKDASDINRLYVRSANELYSIEAQ